MTKIWVLIGYVLSACVVAEILGYFLHRLMHSGLILFLSRNHMKHHLVLYGPLQDQRSAHYHDATDESISLGNIGMEWLVPSALLLLATIASLHTLHVTAFYQTIFIASMLGWSFLMFSYMHDVMHVKDHWLEQVPILHYWFIAARRRHDIHHRALNNKGLMDKNFGIGFFFFDRVFGTITNQEPLFNHSGFEMAQKRFHSILNSD
jgi:sterol desaturase/sphingolipid hydroxylase (fatty acid hydroxylase superfamily)